MELFEFENYKEFIQKHFKTLPKKGRGQYRKLALHLHVNTVVISQIFKGSRDLTAEQACEICDYLGFTEFERDYFLLLVNYGRASTHKLKRILKKQIEDYQAQAKNLKSRLPQDAQLTDESKAIFYSNWYYSAIRLLTDIKGLQDVESLSEALQLPRKTVVTATDFLLRHGLILDSDQGLKIGPKRTHLEANSPLAPRNHANWRLKALEKMHKVSETELFYSGPMVISHELAADIRKRLVSLIEENIKQIETAKSEVLTCLNIDWFKIF